MAEYDGLLIEKYDKMADAYTCRRIVEEGAKAGLKIRLVGVHDCCVREDGVWHGAERLSPVRFVIIRYKWGAVLKALEGLGARCYNPADAYGIYVNKFEQVDRLHSEAFVMPRYLLATAGYGYARIRDELGSPFVAKGLESSMGAEIYKIDSEADFAALTEYAPSKEWLFEEFISTSEGRDMRMYSIRGEVQAAMERRSNGDFRANVALGASVRPIPVTDAMRQIASDIYRQTGLDFVGIDLMYGEDKPVFCEINVMPGLEGIERAGQVNIAERIISVIRDDLEAADAAGDV